jgi:hypothetical protein
LKKNKLNKRFKWVWIVYPVITLILMTASYIAGYSNTSSKDYIRGRSDGLEEVCRQEKQVKGYEDSGKPVSPASDKPAIPVVIDNQSKEPEEDKKNEDDK